MMKSNGTTSATVMLEEAPGLRLVLTSSKGLPRPLFLLSEDLEQLGGKQRPREMWWAVHREYRHHLELVNGSLFLLSLTSPLVKCRYLVPGQMLNPKQLSSRLKHTSVPPESRREGKKQTKNSIGTALHWTTTSCSSGVPSYSLNDQFLLSTLRFSD